METTDAPVPAGGLDYHAVFTALAAPKIVLSTDLVVLDANEAYLEMTGLRLAAIAGRPYLEMLGSLPGRRHRAPVVADACRRALRSRRPEIGAPTRWDLPDPATGDERERYWFAMVLPVLGPVGDVDALLVRVEEVRADDDAPGPHRTYADAVAGFDRENREIALRSTVQRYRDTVAQERVAALELQESVLTPPPATPGLAVDVRYRPATREIRVGGDWYDTVVQPSGRTVVVIGDVTGHDVGAAATMAHLRGIVRTVAYDSDGSPAQILERAQRVAAGLGVDALAAVTVAALGTPRPDGTRELTWSRAGALPLLVRRYDGRAELLDVRGDHLFGLDLPRPRHDDVTLLRPGATLLLFTDGLVERHGEPLPRSLDRMRATVDAMRDVSPERLCDVVLAAQLHSVEDDDVALLAVHVEDA
ncbi:PP2C family protein-serine/threonine phosphatase [Cellulomonas sp. PhB143]|uniref:PP2C family protein-serine/threonine phosphatase n=1 Tax=Cellulomonas sp. PhB143 TaxID=2485186 RepID=UPI000F4ADF44|nr:SpoIIE family protein phosphatase [Cellulomonas sp. PhB143]ROS75457.1 PAS domain-containing protein [Cellulomonas sp. PhB143]